MSGARGCHHRRHCKAPRETEYRLDAVVLNFDLGDFVSWANFLSVDNLRVENIGSTGSPLFADAGAVTCDVGAALVALVLAATK